MKLERLFLFLIDLSVSLGTFHLARRDRQVYLDPIICAV
jgi:hypothetical protein